MSDRRVAAVVCEGQTDVPILRSVIQEVWPDIEEVRSLQPELDETGRARGPAGWTAVQAWCEQHAGDLLMDVLDPDVGDRIDLLLIAIDLDIAIEAGIADPPNEVGAYESGRLHDTMRAWLVTKTRKHIPSRVVLSTPVMAIEAWVIAAIFPKEKAPESIDSPAEFLVQKKRLRRSPKDGTAWKELYRYNGFAVEVARRLDRVRRVCSQANSACGAIEQLREGA